MARTSQTSIDRTTAVRPTVRKKRAVASNAEELSLRDMRKNLNLTQIDVARRLKKGQDVVSRIERRGDLLLSTLSDYVHSLGGELELLCRFKERSAVRICITGKSNAIEADTRKTSIPGVPSSVTKLREPIKLLCERHGVRELSLFGSVLRSDFDHVSSDVDAAVSFGPPPGESMARQYFDFKQDLERLFGRRVDLIELDAMPDTRLKRIIERTKMRVYAATG
ncbi:MAG: nucleotidyltransferase domain-containing protein [Steroidobacteraceae bacterium]